MQIDVVEIALLAAVVALAGLCAVILYKVRKVHIMLFEVRQAAHDMPAMIRWESALLFQQFQLLPELFAELKLERGLPALRGWAASPDFLLLLVRHVKGAGPSRLLECGCGASTIVLARCLQMQGRGHLYSLEHDATFAAATRQRLGALGLEEWATVLDAPLEMHRINDGDWRWYSASALPDGPLDMLVIDGPPVSTGPLARYPAGPLLLPKLALGGQCFMDDMIRDDEKEVVARWIREIPGLQQRAYSCEKGCTALHRG